MFIPPSILDVHPGIHNWAILSGYRGSIAHGMYIPKNDPNSIDDIDIMSICVPPIEYYFGLQEFGSRGTKEIKENEWDIVVYELKKFISLLKKGNPNVISMLWLDKKHYLKMTPCGEQLITNRHLFNSKQIYHSFIGYSRAQLYKMDHLAFQGYMGEKRKQLVKTFGFDLKNAAHLIRLMRMCIEFLKTKQFFVTRPDAKELLEIKRGEWSLERVKAEAEVLFKKAEEAFNICSLPQEVDSGLVDQLCISVLRDTFRWKS